MARRCRRCQSFDVVVARQSVVRRRSRRYNLLWYRCESCQDVSFSYRADPPLLAVIEPPAEADRTLVTPESEPVEVG